MSSNDRFPQTPQSGFDPNAQQGQGFPQAPAYDQTQGQAQNYGQGGAPAQQQFNQPYPGNTGAGYGQPADLAEPKNHKTSVLLLWIALAVGVLGLILGLTMLDSVVDESIKQAKEQNPDIALDRSAFKSLALGGILVIGLISFVLNLLVVIFWKKGHNWARIVLTVFAFFSIFDFVGGLKDMGADPMGSIVSILHALLVFGATVLAWTKPVSEWVKAKKAAKLQAQGY